jgi:two-component system response regulator YesN
MVIKHFYKISDNDRRNQSVENNIKQNYGSVNLSTESLADTIGYTPYYFSKIFKEITGLNVSDYIRQIRINKAKEILSLEENKINEIPGMVGFHSAGGVRWLPP